MEWSEDLATGIGSIDDQHRELINRINALVAAIKQKICRQTIGETFAFLEDYVVSHFGEEEALMRRHAYPEYPQHRTQHGIFMDNLAELRKELVALEGGTKPGSYDLSVETNRVVVDWIRTHILSVDKRLGHFLKQKI